MTEGTARGAGPDPSLVDLLEALDHPGARRRFRVVGPQQLPTGPGFSLLADDLLPAALAALAAADPVSSLGIDELTGTMAFHALAVGPVDLLVSTLLVADVVVGLDPRRVALRREGAGVTELILVEIEPLPAGGDGPDRVAAGLVDVLDPLVVGVEPVDPALRWGAVADLVAVVASVRQRDHGLDPGRAWAAVDGVIEGLRARRPHPEGRPERLDVPAGGGRAPTLALARRSTCCQWYRAARLLGEDSATDARCADCPSLDPLVNLARLTELASKGELARP